ncbi:MAG: class I SAM-dependent methyltransferase [Lachnospiraceae bacterium]|nr:class I SAM-dependent methyltransferase [Lachnospiraceae bacterium]
MNEHMGDWKLGIRTCGSDYSFMNGDDYGYDPTPYSVLGKLAESGLIHKEDTLVDFGCGRGRVGIYLADRIGCRVIGVDYSMKRIAEAERNLTSYHKKERQADIQFVHSNAELFDPREANSFYFFNPFSADIFQKVLLNICEAKRDTGRDMHIFFYYPTSEYRCYFEDERRLKLIEDIDCTNARLWDAEVYRILYFSVL